ncbi:MAG: ATP-binding protein, partial [Gammaproteobacteria bacterium]
MDPIIGRVEEKKLLKEVLQSKEAALVAVYGRRRVGKTFLIHTYFQDHLAFEATAIYRGNLKDQLKVFAGSISRAMK